MEYDPKPKKYQTEREIPTLEVVELSADVNKIHLAVISKLEKTLGKPVQIQKSLCPDQVLFSKS